MNKKELYQLDILKSKINEQTEIIKQLNDKKKIIINDSINNDSINNDSINNEYNIANETNILDSKNKILDLQNKQISLESQQKILKQNIFKISGEIKIQKQKIEDLDNIRDSKIDNEDNIFEEELHRIEENKTSFINDYYINLDLEYENKNKLLNEIEIIKNDLKVQNDIITEVQIDSHSSRKKVIDELHEKKIMKIKNIQTIENYKNDEFIFINKINELEIDNKCILDFKNNIVNLQYNKDYDKTQMKDYYIKYNINEDISINEKIQILDKIFNSNNNQIKLINSKYKIYKINSNINIDEINTQYNNTSRIKTLGYKDKFKIEKDKKNLIENNLTLNIDKYNSFDDIIIKNIVQKFTNNINELEDDSRRANDRLDIMKNRILDEYNDDKIKETNILLYIETQILEQTNEFNNIIIELENVKILIKNENIIYNEIEKIDIEIEKYQQNIIQLNKDLEKLSSS